ncbi:MAG TPA: hypothetical protein VNO30_08510 [Kofleriaceae bacterium]|nr:hypothetical protein [Kofleriaceae bacterium]
MTKRACLRLATVTAVTAVTASLAAACGSGGGGQHVEYPQQEGSGWYVIQLTSARLDARRPDGRPWHTSESDRTALVIGGILGLAAGNPALGLSLGEVASDPGGDPLAPAPFVDLKIEGETYRVSPVGRTYAPTWRQPIAIDGRRRRGDERVIIQIRDGVDEATIGQVETTLGALLGRPAHTFTAIGSIMSLDLTVAPMPARRPASYQVRVPSTVERDELVRDGAPGWRPIPVWNGDTVALEAAGEVCPSSRSECFGPEGAEPGRWRRYSYVEDVPHAALVAAVPGQGAPIGLHPTIRVTQAGSILLFVNDSDVDNNEGWFDVRVTVTPPL